ncbi:unnamed protein product, partial [Coregonus sp. 'balchen']
MVSSRLVVGSEVTQTPTILWGLKDSDAQMNCSHTKGVNYYQMYWYRQRPGEGIKQNHQHDHAPHTSSNSTTMGLSQTDKVHQTPTEILKRPEDKVQLSCSHNVSNYYMILWYQQSAQNTALKLIGYVRYTSPMVEDSFLKSVFNVSGDGAANKMAYLHIPKLREAEDSAVYFCAATGSPYDPFPTRRLPYPYSTRGPAALVPPPGGLVTTVPPPGGLAAPTVSPQGGPAHPPYLHGAGPYRPPLGGWSPYRTSPGGLVTLPYPMEAGSPTPTFPTRLARPRGWSPTYSQEAGSPYRSPRRPGRPTLPPRRPGALRTSPRRPGCPT